jgi:hypothetical protein
LNLHNAPLLYSPHNLRLKTILFSTYFAVETAKYSTHFAAKN